MSVGIVVSSKQDLGILKQLNVRGGYAVAVVYV
jgi:hypothetical protein